MDIFFTLPALTISFLVGVALFAGVVKGAVGFAMPLILMSGLSAVLPVPVALAGRVYVWADASAGPIEPGDLLTTSSHPGHAMRVDDPARSSGAILGKAIYEGRISLKELEAFILNKD